MQFTFVFQVWVITARCRLTAQRLKIKLIYIKYFTRSFAISSHRKVICITPSYVPLMRDTESHHSIHVIPPPKYSSYTKLKYATKSFFRLWSLQCDDSLYPLNCIHKIFNTFICIFTSSQGHLQFAFDYSTHVTPVIKSAKCFLRYFDNSCIHHHE